MPDDFGRLTLKEMREAVWENCSAIFTSVAPDGERANSANWKIDPLFSKQTVDRFINEALTARCVELMINAESALADEQVIDITAGIIEYQLPGDVAFVRSLWWKPPDTTYEHNTERLFMHMLEEGSILVPAINNGAPTYRRTIDGIVLNSIPDKDNPGGIMVRYVKWMLYMAEDDAVLETTFSRMLQEVLILDASVAALGRKAFLDTSELRQEQAKAAQTLTLAARNSNMPPFVNMVTRHQLASKARPRWSG